MGRLGKNPSSRGYATPTYATTSLTARETFGGTSKAGLGRHIGMGRFTYSAIVNGSGGHQASFLAGNSFPAAFRAGQLLDMKYPISDTNQLSRIGTGTTGGMTRTPADGVNLKQREEMQTRVDKWNKVWPAMPQRDTPNDCCKTIPNLNQDADHTNITSNQQLYGSNDQKLLNNFDYFTIAGTGNFNKWDNSNLYSIVYYFDEIYLIDIIDNNTKFLHSKNDIKYTNFVGKFVVLYLPNSNKIFDQYLFKIITQSINEEEFKIFVELCDNNIPSPNYVGDTAIVIPKNITNPDEFNYSMCTRNYINLYFANDKYNLKIPTSNLELIKLTKNNPNNLTVEDIINLNLVNNFLFIYYYNKNNDLVQDVFKIIKQVVLTDENELCIFLELELKTTNNILGNFIDPNNIINGRFAAIFIDPVNSNNTTNTNSNATYSKWVSYYNNYYSNNSSGTWNFSDHFLPSLNGLGGNSPSGTYQLTKQYPGSNNNTTRVYNLSKNGDSEYNISSDPKSQTGYFIYPPQGDINKDCGLDMNGANASSFSTRNIRWYQDINKNVALVVVTSVTNSNGQCKCIIKPIDFYGELDYDNWNNNYVNSNSNMPAITDDEITFCYKTDNSYNLINFAGGCAGGYNLFLNYDEKGLTQYDQSQYATINVDDYAYIYGTEQLWNGTVLFDKDASSNYPDAACPLPVSGITDIKGILPKLVKVTNIDISNNIYTVSDKNNISHSVNFKNLFKGNQYSLDFAQRLYATFYPNPTVPPGNDLVNGAIMNNFDTWTNLIQEASIGSEPVSNIRPNEVNLQNSYPKYLSLGIMATSYHNTVPTCAPSGTQPKNIIFPKIATDLEFNDKIVVMKISGQPFGGTPGNAEQESGSIIGFWPALYDITSSWDSGGTISATSTTAPIPQSAHDCSFGWQWGGEIDYIEAGGAADISTAFALRIPGPIGGYNTVLSPYPDPSGLLQIVTDLSNLTLSIPGGAATVGAYAIGNGSADYVYTYLTNFMYKVYDSNWQRAHTVDGSANRLDNSVIGSANGTADAFGKAYSFSQVKNTMTSNATAVDPSGRPWTLAMKTETNNLGTNIRVYIWSPDNPNSCPGESIDPNNPSYLGSQIATDCPDNKTGKVYNSGGGGGCWEESASLVVDMGYNVACAFDQQLIIENKIGTAWGGQIENERFQTLLSELSAAGAPSLCTNSFDFKTIQDTASWKINMIKIFETDYAKEHRDAIRASQSCFCATARYGTDQKHNPWILPSTN